MSAPFFTIAIPTKNRSDRLANAVKSVLWQTFTDVEVVVCDNSDEAEAVKTAAAVRLLDDPRVRYVRTSGSLSMPDNWDTAIADARGEFVGILTDRSVFRRDALQVVSDEIEKTDARVVSWFNDLYGRNAAGTRFQPRGHTLKRHRFDSETVLDYFVHGDPKYAPKIIPKLMTGVCHRSILETIRASPAGRCCPPVAPDYTSGFLMLAYSDWILTLDEALYVICGTGNGADFRRGGALSDRFRRDLGMTWDDMVDLMPSGACFAHALILNDFMRVKTLVPDRLPSIEIDRAQYYLGCMNDYVKTARHGVKRDEDLHLLLEAFDQEPEAVRHAVRSTRIYTLATSSFQLANRAAKIKNAINNWPAFDDVFDALEWDEANPRTPIAESFLDRLPGLEAMKESSAIERMRRRVRLPTRLREFVAR